MVEGLRDQDQRRRTVVDGVYSDGPEFPSHPDIVSTAFESHRGLYSPQINKI